MLVFITLLPLAWASFTAADSQRQKEVFADFQAACLPRDSHDNIKIDSPCFAMMGIVGECGWGDDWLTTYEKSLPFAGDVWDPIPIQDQRACFCQSRYFEMLEACQSCIKVNNIPINDTIVVVEAGLPLPSPTVVASFTSSYCAITNTPTAFYGDAVYKAFNWTPRRGNMIYQLDRTIPSSALPTATSYTTYAPSYGYIPMITAPTAYPVIPQTDHTGNDNEWVTQIASAVPTLATSNGQIVPAGESAQKAYLAAVSASASSYYATRNAQATQKGAAPRDPPKKPATTGGLLALIAALIICH